MLLQRSNAHTTRALKGDPHGLLTNSCAVLANAGGAVIEIDGKLQTCAGSRVVTTRLSEAPPMKSAAQARASRWCRSIHSIRAVLPVSVVQRISERGARMARRDDRGYREYLREEQGSQPGCPARKALDK